jgi:hypothetical protein
MVGVSLIACGKFIAPSQARVRLDWSDREQARREDKQTEQAMPRTEPGW